jgi:hypothetical protein
VDARALARGRDDRARRAGGTAASENALSPAGAGVAAAAAWTAVEPILRSLLGTPYSDVRLVGVPLSRRHWRTAGTAVHLTAGAVAGVAFHRLGLRGWKQGVAAALVENTVLWPGMAVVDRFHPDRRSGAWPPLLRNPRVFAQETAVHALFGAVLGLLLRDDESGRIDGRR